MGKLSSARKAGKRCRYKSIDSSVVRYLPGSHDVSIDAEESLLLGAAAKRRLEKTLQAGEDLACSDL
jgi:hypothetical protein